LGGSGSYAWGINSSGWVVGAAYASYGSLPKPFLYRDGQMEDLLPNYGDAMFGEAQAINSSGAVVGFRNASYGDRATLWQNGQVVDLGWGYATAINDLGQIVGYVGTNANAQALLFQNGSAVNLGSLGGAVTRAFGINNSGWVVGMGWNSSQESRAFIYRQGTLTNLNSLIAPEQGWTLHEARGVNASGQIVGWGTRAGDHYAHAFLLNPVTEPGSLAGLTLGFLLMKRFSRRRR
ncbi:MAG TPA: hypothetical protein VEX38_00960, partial [Fimbriimonadaceae bacterium]|nr:hypothetical protein [Fimbriimonadaceae bacterium]